MRTCLAYLFAVLFLAPIAGAQQDDWHSLSTIKPNAKIEVIDQQLRRHSGTFMGFTEAGVTVRENGQPVTVERSDVYRVTVIHEKRVRNALIGTAAGFGAGLALGAAIMEREQCYGCAVAGTGVAVAAVGAGAGALLPSSRTVYRSVAAKAKK